MSEPVVLEAPEVTEVPEVSEVSEAPEVQVITLQNPKYGKWLTLILTYVMFFFAPWGSFVGKSLPIRLKGLWRKTYPRLFKNPSGCGRSRRKRVCAFLIHLVPCILIIRDLYFTFAVNGGL